MIEIPLTSDRLKAFREDLADESVQVVAGENLSEIMRQAGLDSWGALVKLIPLDDLSSALGAITDNDPKGACQALEKAVLKTLAAESAGAAASMVTTSAATPVAIAILASVLTGMAYNYVLENYEVVLKEEIKRKQADLKSSSIVRAAERNNYHFQIKYAAMELSLVRLQAQMVEIDINWLEHQLHLRQTDLDTYKAEFAKRIERYQSIIANYDKISKNLKDSIGDLIAHLQNTMQALQDQHRALKEQLDANHGYDTQASCLMSDIYKEFMTARKEFESLKDLKQLSKDTPVALVTSIDISKRIEERLPFLNAAKLDALMANRNLTLPEGLYDCLCQSSLINTGVGVTYSDGKCRCVGPAGGVWDISLPHDSNSWNYCLNHQRYPDGSTLVDVLTKEVIALRQIRGEQTL